MYNNRQPPSSDATQDKGHSSTTSPLQTPLLCVVLRCLHCATGHLLPLVPGPPPCVRFTYRPSVVSQRLGWHRRPSDLPDGPPQAFIDGPLLIAGRLSRSNHGGFARWKTSSSRDRSLPVLSLMPSNADHIDD